MKSERLSVFWENVISWEPMYEDLKLFFKERHPQYYNVGFLPLMYHMSLLGVECGKIIQKLNVTYGCNHCQLRREVNQICIHLHEALGFFE